MAEMEKLYKIKLLEWIATLYGGVRTNDYTYIIGKEGDKFECMEIMSLFDSLESAKLACQEHYLSRLMGSLEEVDTLERVKERCLSATNGREYMQDGWERGQAYFAQQILNLIDNKQ